MNPPPPSRRERLRRLQAQSSLLRLRLATEVLVLAHSRPGQRTAALWRGLRRVGPWARLAWRWGRSPSAQALAAAILTAWPWWRARRR